MIPETADSNFGTNAFGTLYTVIGTIGAVIATAFPLMKLIQRWGTTKTDNAKANAEISLYDSLRVSLEDNSKAIALLQKEKNNWLIERADLRGRIERLEGIELQNQQLRGKLDEKDTKVSELMTEIISKSREITELRERLHQLELRLTKDERLIAKKKEVAAHD